ncbi:hypothetical protein Pint_35120 [Pistacia integerrima]|uniref:Uncharacterized protein n=1 Tax=Pistacia integerrima TaxID=434235 RepID=A0ACC0Y2F2_9ROSI|nr:hypothetical protein Pint_35120 [Pistacia integerrima]
MPRWRFSLIGIILVLLPCHFLQLASAQITHPLEVNALQAVRRALKDTGKNLNSWKKTDPCVSNWTGVICLMDPNDGHLHVQELRLLNMKLSGKLAPSLGLFSHMTVLNFMWNNLTGSIPKEIGNLITLKLLLLSGNQISGPIPDELGSLSNVTILNLDINNISGPLPKTLANMTSAGHFHLNNNSISGQIPPELSALPQLLHFLLDNNNLSGYLPQEFSRMPNLMILQLDNNNFEGTEIPNSYKNMPKLVKLSLRNCRLQGTIPDFSSVPNLLYLDLSSNQLTGSIPTNKLAKNITTIDLSNNMLSGPIPSNFFRLYSSPETNVNFRANVTLTLDFQNNSLTNVSGTIDPPSNVTIRLQGNPICTSTNEFNIVQFCGPNIGDDEVSGTSNNTSNPTCLPQSCPASLYMEYVPESPASCFCALPLGVDVRLKSPCISDFPPYMNAFVLEVTSSLGLNRYQLLINSLLWQNGRRLLITLKVFPQYINNTTNEFNKSEVYRIMDRIATFTLSLSDVFGPYELINFTRHGPYADVILEDQKSGMSKGAVIGIVLGSIAGLIAISLVFLFIFCKRKSKHKQEVSKKQSTAKIPIKAASVKGFSFTELEKATSGFSESSLVGQGGYGKVYKGILDNGTAVAIKRAQQGSFQGEREFLTEIEILSRVHHRNLVSLVGYCDEEVEQILVYEFMPNGSVDDLLYGRFRNPMSFAMRLHIALGSAKGIIYLHKEADPPIIHRDIKANNILLDSKFTAKVSDFGISKLAPVPTDSGGEGHVFTAVRGTPVSTLLKPSYEIWISQVNSACQSGMMHSIIDSGMGPYSSECLKRFMALALKCCEDETERRPSMLEVVRELENLSSMLPESETILTDSDISASGSSGIPTSSLYSERNSYVSGDFPEAGSDLVSGVVPTIRPR